MHFTNGVSRIQLIQGDNCEFKANNTPTTSCLTMWLELRVQPAAAPATPLLRRLSNAIAGAKPVGLPPTSTSQLVRDILSLKRKAIGTFSMQCDISGPWQAFPSATIRSGPASTVRRLVVLPDLLYGNGTAPCNLSTTLGFATAGSCSQYEHLGHNGHNARNTSAVCIAVGHPNALSHALQSSW